jgi:hypothetical protein
MKRIGFPVLLATIACILIVVAFTASVAARQPMQAAQPNSIAASLAPNAPISAAPVDGSKTDAPATLPSTSSFDQALSSGRLARFSH